MGNYCMYLPANGYIKTSSFAINYEFSVTLWIKQMDLIDDLFIVNCNTADNKNYIRIYDHFETTSLPG